MKQYLLSVDNGGTYIKAAIYDKKGNRIGVARRHNKILEPAPGWAEYDQSALWQMNCSCIKRVLENTHIPADQIACIGIAGQGCGFYAIDKDGNNIRNAISSSDTRAHAQALKLEKIGINKIAYQYIYRNSAPGNLNSILIWLKENEPENYHRIDKLFSMKDFLVYQMTHNAISSYGCQSASGLMDLNTGKFSPYLGELFGIPEMIDKFGPLKWDYELCGTLTEEAAESCSLKAGIPVSAGAHDVIAAVFAMNAYDSELCFMITGTHGINGYISSSPVLNGTVKNNEYFAFPGRFLIEEGYPSSTATLEWAISLLFQKDTQDSSGIYDCINREVESIDPNDCSLIFLPFLRGNRDNDCAAGAWIGLRNEHTRAHMLTAVYEGVAFSHMLQMEHIFMNREKPPKIRMAGGATNSGIWMHIFADTFNIPLEIVPNEEMGTKGAAIIAAVSSRIYPDFKTAVDSMTCTGETVYPRKEYTGIYRKKLERFKKIVKSLDPCWETFDI